MPNRRTLTVPDPEDFGIAAQWNVCRLCEGDGQLARDFDIRSVGQPAVIDCPNCTGTGRSGKTVTMTFQQGDGRLAISMTQERFGAFATVVHDIEALLAKADEEAAQEGE